MSQNKKIIFFSAVITLVFLFCLSTPLWAQPARNNSINEYLDYYSQRQRLEETHRDWQSEKQQKIHQKGVEAARRDHKKTGQQIEKRTLRTQPRRSQIIKNALDNAAFKINTGYMFVRGEQTFRLPHPTHGGNLSKLTYPIKGGMGFVNAEFEIAAPFSVGARYAHSNFKNTTSKDEDWNFEKTAIWEGVPDTKWADYQVTEQNAKNEAYLWDVNLYYRLTEWDEENMGQKLADFLRVDKLYLDVFAGYQYYKGKHTMTDPMTRYNILAENSWWYGETPHLGLNSLYEVSYKGPRIGVRLEGSITDKLSSSLSLSYAWIRSNADAYWNLRDFNWRHRNKGRGSAFNLDFETEYHFNSNWFVGGNFFYTWQNQPKSKYFGNYGPDSLYPGDSFEYEARDTRLRIFGLALKTGYRW